MSEFRSATSSTTFGLYTEPRARINVNLLGPNSALPGTIQIDLQSGDSRQSAYVYLTWEQARELRHRLSVAIEAAIRSDVSIEEAVERG